MKMQMRNQIIERLESLWTERPRDLTEDQQKDLAGMFYMETPIKLYFLKWLPTLRSLDDMELPPDLAVQGLCGQFLLETEMDITKAINVHIDYIARALYYSNFHPDKHVITGICMKLAKPTFGKLTDCAYVLPTYLHIDLVANVDPGNPCKFIDVAAFPDHLIGCVQ